MKTESLQAGEYLAARGATAPRVTLNDIKNSVAAVYFTTADKLMPGDEPADPKHVEQLSILTICVVVLNNGFTLIGKSAPASAENYTREKGEEFAYEDALRQCWPLMGFALRDRLYRDSGDFEIFERVTGGSTGNIAEQNGDDLVGDILNSASQAETLPAIPADEELEGLHDGPVKDLALAHGIEYVDRAYAIDKLKIKRHSISGQPNPV